MLRPTKNRVLVRLEKEPQGLLHVPESFQEDSQWGTVSAIGPEVKDLVVGDRVFFIPQRSFNEIHSDGVRYKLFREQDLEGKEMREGQPIPE